MKWHKISVGTATVGYRLGGTNVTVERGYNVFATTTYWITQGYTFDTLREARKWAEAMYKKGGETT